MPDSDVTRRLTAALRAQADLMTVCDRESAHHSPAAVVLPLVGPDDRRRHRPNRHRLAMSATAAALVAAAVVVAMVVTTTGERAQSTHRGPEGVLFTPPAATTRPATRPKSAAPDAFDPALLGVAPTVRARPVGAAQARALLDAAGSARARAGDPHVGPGQYLLMRTVEAPTVDDTRPTTVPGYDLDRIWAPSDATTLWVRKRETVRAAGPRPEPNSWSGLCNELYASDDGGEPGGTGCGRPGNHDDVSPRHVAGLPRTVAALYARLRSDAAAQSGSVKSGPVDARMFSDIETLFTSDAIPADLQAALIGVLARIPSAQSFVDTTTWLGRTGIAVQVDRHPGSTDPYATNGIIIDPRTGAYLGSYSGTPNTAGYQPTDCLTTVTSVPPPPA